MTHVYEFENLLKIMRNVRDLETSQYDRALLIFSCFVAAQNIIWDIFDLNSGLSHGRFKNGFISVVNL